MCDRVAQLHLQRVLQQPVLKPGQAEESSSTYTIYITRTYTSKIRICASELENGLSAVAVPIPMPLLTVSALTQTEDVSSTAGKALAGPDASDHLESLAYLPNVHRYIHKGSTVLGVS